MKKVIITLFVLIFGCTLGLIGLIINITWDQYQDTKDWEALKFGDEIKDVPPFLARNYVNAEDKDAAVVWQQVADALENIKERSKTTKYGTVLSADERKTFANLLATALTLQETYHITSGQIAKQNEDLQLYLDLEAILSNAYEHPNTQELIDITNRLYTVNLQYGAPVDDLYFKRLRNVAKDYKALSQFLKKEFPKLGTYQDGVLTIGEEVDEETTKEVLAAIDKGNLKAFPFLTQLQTWLTGSDWEKALHHNEIVKEFQQWKEAEHNLLAVQKSQYIKADTILTLKDAADAGFTIDAPEKEGYQIKPESPVAMLIYENVVVGPEQYIRYGAEVTAVIEEPEYEELPTEEVLEGEETTGTTELEDAVLPPVVDPTTQEEWEPNEEEEEETIPEEEEEIIDGEEDIPPEE